MAIYDAFNLIGSLVQSAPGATVPPPLLLHLLLLLLLLLVSRVPSPEPLVNNGTDSRWNVSTPSRNRELSGIVETRGAIQEAIICEKSLKILFNPSEIPQNPSKSTKIAKNSSKSIKNQSKSFEIHKTIHKNQ